MKTYNKNYIGKGTQEPNIQIVKVTVKVAKLLKRLFKDEIKARMEENFVQSKKFSEMFKPYFTI